MSFTALVSRLSGQAAAPAGDAAAKAAHLPLHEGLVVSHGISPMNIVDADATTGLALASPSLGVHKTTNPNMDFGSILLMGKPKVLDDPKSSTYMSDVYSRRKPEISTNTKRITPPEVKALFDEAFDMEPAIQKAMDEGDTIKVVELQSQQEGITHRALALKAEMNQVERVPQFVDNDLGKVVEATPENLVAYMNRVEDRLTEGLFSKQAVDDPSTILAATADEVGGSGGIQEVRHLLEGDLATTKKKMVVDKRDWRNLTADLGGLEGLTSPRIMQEISGRLMVDIISHMKANKLNATEALLDMRNSGLFPEKLLPLLNTEHLPRLADSLAYGSTNYAEVRPHRMLEVRQGGELDTAIVSRQDMLTDPDGQKAVAILKAQGVDVHVIDAPWATPEYQRAFYEKMADLKKKGYVFGVGGATVAAGVLAPAEDSMAAELPAGPAAEAPERSQKADKAQGATTVAPAAQDAPQSPAGGFTGIAGRMGGGFAARRAAERSALGAKPGRFAGFTGQIRQMSQQSRQDRQQEIDVTPKGLDRLVVDEGERLKVYKDSLGIDTIGVGFNLEEPANHSIFQNVVGFSVEEAKKGRLITKAQSRELLAITADRARLDAERLLPQLESYPPEVQDAITNFVFNVGLRTAGKFVNTFAAIKRRDGTAAASGIRNSRYYQQVGKRGERIAQALERLK